MNLPILNDLNVNGQSTYITFSKALLDFDKAISQGNEYVFSKMIALNLPNWRFPEFFIDLSSIGINSQNPNIVLPKLFENYLENICRTLEHENSSEIAFWKSLNKCGISYEDIKNSVVFVNDIVLSNFTHSENNNGWGEIICQIPNNCKKLIPKWKIDNSIPDITPSEYIDGLFDNDYFQFLFENKELFDFENISYDSESVTEFNFNCLLLFYKDSTGKNKLHGINFINNFDNKITYWSLPEFRHISNQPKTIGYQFKFNHKTCNNEASQTYVFENNEHMCWDTFGETMTILNTFLKSQIKK